MATFETPIYLHYAWLAVLLVGGYALSRYRAVRACQRAGGERFAATAFQGRAQAVSLGKLFLQVLAVGGLVLALANPRQLVDTPRSQVREGAKLVFVVDVSASMLAADVLPDRVSQVRKLLADVVRQLDGEQVGIVVFAGEAQLYLPLTTDYEHARSVSAQITPDLVARQGTSLPKALALAGWLFTGRTGQPSAVCVLSDGESHSRRFQGVVDSLRRAGIALFSVGFGTPAGAHILVADPESGHLSPKTDRRGVPVVSRLDEGFLRALVRNEARRYQRFDPGGEAASTLVRELRALQPPRLGRQTTGYSDAFPLFLLASFLLLLLDFVVSPSFRN